MNAQHPPSHRRLFRRLVSVFLVVAVAILCNLTVATPLQASELQIARVNATEVRVSLSDEQGSLKFYPNRLEFIAGRTYKLILDNPSPEKHYFTATDFAAASWTRKVEAAGVEVKGNVRELELKPGAEAEWVFVPEKTGTYDLRCTISGHAEAGMTGTLEITAASESA